MVFVNVIRQHVRTWYCKNTMVKKMKTSPKLHLALGAVLGGWGQFICLSLAAVSNLTLCFDLSLHCPRLDELDDGRKGVKKT